MSTRSQSNTSVNEQAQSNGYTGKQLAQEILCNMRPYVEMTGIQSNEKNSEDHDGAIKALDQAFITVGGAFFDIPVAVANKVQSTTAFGLKSSSGPDNGPSGIAAALSALKSTLYGGILAFAWPAGVAMMAFSRIQALQSASAKSVNKGEAEEEKPKEEVHSEDE
ncbi:hypothetical protein DSO57_1015653 [Entomophthora muscae]|uniref:Uncharacterized protein n=2 Tax=Entomophthora muscae TaxID=34485 RepID=A0ACC2TGW4_9FUNG|nr:hypothetical protein DSO57_1004847 [Entomophthora muscae]KAJ9073517.1 hypothetical protein DSO57_1015653 [Entomophthora muscae]